MKEVTEKQRIQEAFSWLYDEEKEITHEEIDLAMAPYYEDPHIYYTEEFYQIFQTKAMERLRRVLQLAAYVMVNPNAYHTRLDHCKGSYRIGLELIAIKMQDQEWREFIEKHGLKQDLIEALKYIAIHDVGHSMLSHAIERLMGDSNCDHEMIGDKISKEDTQLSKTLDVANREEEHTKETQGVLHTLCEGNVDFDRLDFLVRDFLYMGCEYFDHDKIIEILSSCKMREIQEEGKKKTILVYPKQQVENIKALLLARDRYYANEIKSSKCKVYDGLNTDLAKWITNEEIDQGKELQSQLRDLIGKSIEEIDIQRYIQGNSLTWFNGIIEIAEKSENENLRQLARICIPQVKALCQMTIHMLGDLPKEELTQEDKEFIGHVQRMTKGKSNLSHFLRKGEVSQEQRSQKEELQEDISYLQSQQKDQVDRAVEKIQEVTGEIANSKGIQINHWKRKEYNVNEPMYIEDEKGKIATLDNYVTDFKTHECHFLYLVPPMLREEGFTEEQIEQMKQIVRTFNEKIPKVEQIKESNRMSMFRTENEGNYEKMSQTLEEIGR